MGFNIDSDTMIVSVDHSHNDYCVTTVEGNPAIVTKDNLEIISIFSRTKRGRRHTKTIGDNCPMLYALKGSEQLITTAKDVVKLRINFRKILNIYLSRGYQWDWIVPLPSSSNLSQLLANEVFNISNMGVVQQDLLIKITNKEALSIAKSLRIHSSDKANITSAIRGRIKKMGEEDYFQIKYINKSDRIHMKPFIFNKIPLGSPPPRKLLLIDDMITSGTSLVSAMEVIKSRYPLVKIEALTLFGS